MSSKVPKDLGKNGRHRNLSHHGGRSLTGCALCRIRKVKCDGHRPRCLRCAKYGLKCPGYGIGLKYTDIFTVKDGRLIKIPSPDFMKAGDGYKIKRRKIPFVHYPPSQLYLNENDMDLDLNMLAEVEDHPRVRRLGPFGCFPLTSSVKSSSSATLNPSIANIINDSPDDIDRQSPAEVRAVQSIPPAASPSSSYPPLDLLNYSTNDITPTLSERDNTDIIVPRKIWIHPRFRMYAVLTYKALLGDADATSKSGDAIQRIIFSDYYGETHRVCCQISELFDVPDNEINLLKNQRLNSVYESLKLKQSPTKRDLPHLLKEPPIKEMLNLFSTYSRNLSLISFRDSIVDVTLIPLVHKIVRELIPLKSGISANEECTDNDDPKNHFKNYCILIKQTFIAIVLAIGAFEKFKTLFNEFGLYHASRNYLKCYIDFRQVAIYNISKLIHELVKPYSKNDPIYINNLELLDKLITSGIINQFLSVLILAIKQDEILDIVVNYKLLYSVLQAIREHLLSLDISDSHLIDLLLWIKYLHFFFYATATIDVEHYQIKEPGFEDLDANYNLIRNFNFNDSFRPEEYNQIKIKQTVAEDVSSTDEDDTSNSDVNDSDYETTFKATLPKRLANRPPVKDKPPRSFTVHFCFGNESSNDDGDDDNAESDTSDSVKSDTNNNDLSSEWQNLNAKTRINGEGVKVDVLTGLAVVDQKQSNIEKQNHKNGDSDKLRIPVPFELSKLKGISSIEISCGLPVSLLDLMIRAITISNHRNWFLRKKIFPRNFPKFCCDLEEDLMTWKLPWDLYKRSSDKKKEFHSMLHEALYHQILCFYNAVLMFFFRIIKDTDPSLLQNYVVSTLEHLEELHRISVDPKFGQDFKMHVPFWCYFLCGSDAISRSLQSKYDSIGGIWFSSWEKWIGKQMILEIWRGRNYGMNIDEQIEGITNNEQEEEEAEEDKEASWLDLIKGWEMSGYH